MDYFRCASGKRRRKTAQPNFEEKSEIEELHIESTDVMTGDRNKSRYLVYQLKFSIAQAKQTDIIVSFLMESGVRILLNDLKAALYRGVQIRILTGNYLGITQPSALFLLKKELGDKVELVRILLNDLKAALYRGVQIRILTGNYLGITQPSALFLLKKELGDKVELRFYNEKIF